ncbi:MBL fold metallo-hydrolase [Mycobacterium sp.]|uniref:MBL fold metallo-hydrolase n=1 Tax=Mycobacterium sp. TaxID=1785 RepID=UPI003D0C4F84
MTEPTQPTAAEADTLNGSSTLRLEVITSPTRQILGGANRTFSPTTSTLISGNTDAVLVDTQFIIDDVDALADIIDTSGKNLTTIYITHGHLDHYFGIARLLTRFPSARAVATLAVVDHIESAVEDDLKWGRGLFGDVVAHPDVLPTPLDSSVIELEGHQLRSVEVGQGDIAPSTVLHIPALEAVIAGDVAYNQIHQMMAFGGPEQWHAWMHSIDHIKRLAPMIVVAGHKKPDAPDTDIAAILDGSRDYIHDFATAVNTSSNPAQVVAVMTEKYPNRGNLTTLKASAAAAFS